MPSGVYVRTAIAKENIRKAMIGRIPWNKGKTGIYSKETLLKISNNNVNKGKPNPQLSELNRNKVYTPEIRKIMSERQRGEKGSNWRGGIANKNMIFRNSIEGKLWRESVFTRDDYTCQICLIRGNKLNAHHLDNFADYFNLRFAIDNGITLCKDCHKKFHKEYGTRHTNKQHFELWKRDNIS